MLADQGIGFVDCGTSGGVWGLENGYSLMVGGSDADVAIAQPIFDALAPPSTGSPTCGPVGAGHYMKMVHNGVEYGIMQAYAEGYAILETSDLDIDSRAALGAWQEGSVVRSWLLDLLVQALDADARASSRSRAWPPTPARAGGRSTRPSRNGVAAPVISAALFARFVSQDEGGDDIAMKVVAALRHQFGGHAVELGTPAARSERLMARAVRRARCCSGPRATWPTRRSSRPSTSWRRTVGSTCR